VEALSRLEEIDRTACRRHVEEAFSPKRVVAAYERLFHSFGGGDEGVSRPT
jgi:hypothetical protein